MAVKAELAEIEAAIDAESAEWLEDANPVLADAIAAGVRRGATPAHIRAYVLRHCGREALALRCEQVARHLVRQAGNGQ